jgi:ankyrin repeat protein
MIKTGAQYLARVPADVLAHVLAFAVQTFPEFASVGAAARVLLEARSAAALRLRVEGRRVNVEAWAVLVEALASRAPNCCALHFQGCNLDHLVVDYFVESLPHLSELSLSKCFCVQGALLMARLDVSASAQRQLRVAMLADLPLVHTAVAFPALPQLICLGLTNCNLEASFAAAGSMVGRVPFLELLAGALAAGYLPRLKHLFLGGAVLEPDSATGGGEEEPAAQANVKADDALRAAHAAAPCPCLATLEVTFLAPLVVARLRRVLAHALNPATAVLCLATAPLRDLQGALDPVAAAFPAAAQGATEARNKQGGSALHAACGAGPGARAAARGVAGASSPRGHVDNNGDGDLRVLWLLGLGARPSLRDDKGATPLFRAAERGASEAALHALLRGGADAVGEVNHRREGPLFIAALKGQAHAVRALVQTLGPNRRRPVQAPASNLSARLPPAPPPTFAASPVVAVAGGLNPLAAEWRPAAVSVAPSPLASATAGKAAGGWPGARALTAQTSDAEGFSPLHCAVLRRCDATLAALLQVGLFDLEAPTKHGQTALHLAVRAALGSTSGFEGSVSPPAALQLVQRLLAHGADANARDGVGAAPLDYCAPDGGHALTADVEATLLLWGAVPRQTYFYSQHGGACLPGKKPHLSKQPGGKGKGRRPNGRNKHQGT